jgi:hypothetical protein
MKGTVGLVAGACMALAIACAASQQPLAVAPQMAPTSAGSSHDQIQMLADQIDSKRV